MISAWPARPSAGARCSEHEPTLLQVVLNVDGDTGNSGGVEDDTDTRSALGRIAPAIVNGTVSEPFCGTT